MPRTGTVYQHIRIVGAAGNMFAVEIDDDPLITRYFTDYNEALMRAIFYLASSRDEHSKEAPHG